MKPFRDDAVSPVIAVMLMLVVTIIIAAIVSGFAGGMIQTDDKAPQATIQGKFSQSTGLELIHTGGDELVTKDIQIILRRTDEFGSGLGMFQPVVVDNAYIQDQYGNYWFNASDGTMAVMVFRPGESMYINGSDMSKSKLASWPPVAPSGGGPGTNTNINFGCTANVGKAIILEVSHTSGKLISKSRMLITP